MLPVQIDEIVNLLDILSFEEKKCLSILKKKNVNLSIDSEEFIILVNGVRRCNAVLPASWILNGCVTIRKITEEQTKESTLSYQIEKETPIVKNLSEIFVDDPIEEDIHNLPPIFKFYRPDQMPEESEVFFSKGQFYKKPNSSEMSLEIKETRYPIYTLEDGFKLRYQRFEVKAPMILFLPKLRRPLYIVYDPTPFDAVKCVDVRVSFPKIDKIWPVVIYKSETFPLEMGVNPFIKNSIGDLDIIDHLNTKLIEQKLIPSLNMEQNKYHENGYINSYSFQGPQVNGNDVWLRKPSTQDTTQTSKQDNLWARLVSTGQKLIFSIAKVWDDWKSYRAITEAKTHFQFIIQDKRKGMTLVDVYAEFTLPPLLAGK